MRSALCLLLMFWWHPQDGRTQDFDYEYVNRNLRQWLQLIDSDRSYLLIDRHINKVMLMHRKAVLRAVPIGSSSFGERSTFPTTLERHLRRYRPTYAPATIDVFPFDWEDNLAVMANPRCALFFANGLLLFADPAWGKPKPPCIEIGAADLTVLYDAMVVGTPVVYLPPNWKEALGRE